MKTSASSPWLFRLVAARPLLSALLIVSPAVAQATSIVAQWNAVALAEVRLSRLGPPVVARALAVAHTCMYDAWTPYDTRAIGVVLATPRRPAVEQNDVNKAKAVSFAAYRCLSNLFPAGAGRLQAKMAQLGYDANDVSTNLATPQGIGNAAANAVIAHRRFDGSNQYGDLAAGAYADYTGYVPQNGADAVLPAHVTTGACPLNNATDRYALAAAGDQRHRRQSTQRFASRRTGERVTPFAMTSASASSTPRARWRARPNVPCRGLVQPVAGRHRQHAGLQRRPSRCTRRRS